MLLVYRAFPDPWIQPIIWCLGIIHNPEGDVFVEAPPQEEYRWGLADYEVEPEVGALVPGYE